MNPFSSVWYRHEPRLVLIVVILSGLVLLPIGVNLRILSLVLQSRSDAMFIEKRLSTASLVPYED